jgi:hypothetical protein
MTGPEQVTETAILYAVMTEDTDRAKALIGESLDIELTDLYGWLSQAIDLVTTELRSRRTEGGPVI